MPSTRSGPRCRVTKAREGVKVSSGEAGVEFLPADELQRLRRPRPSSESEEEAR